MATLPWQVSLPGAYGQPSVGACLLTFQPDGACPAPSHQLLPGPLPPAPLVLSICQSPFSTAVSWTEGHPPLRGPSSSPAPHFESLWTVPSVVLASRHDPGGPPPTPGGHHWTQQGRRDTPPSPSTPGHSVFAA